VDIKEAGSLLYLIGETKAELGGSEYYRLRRVDGGIVPRTDPAVLKMSMESLLEAMKGGLIASCHDVSEGGLAVAICEMLLGGDIGASINIAGVNPNKPLQGLRGRGAEPHMRSDYKLFAESNSRWVVEVCREEAGRFEDLLKGREVYVTKIGETVEEKRVVISDRDKKLVNISLEEVRAAWSGKIC
jgi:phosphoribosylformylglycinamidine synthase